MDTYEVRFAINSPGRNSQIQSTSHNHKNNQVNTQHQTARNGPIPFIISTYNEIAVYQTSFHLSYAMHIVKCQNEYVTLGWVDVDGIVKMAWLRSTERAFLRPLLRPTHTLSH